MKQILKKNIYLVISCLIWIIFLNPINIYYISSSLPSGYNEVGTFFIIFVAIGYLIIIGWVLLESKSCKKYFIKSYQETDNEIKLEKYQFSKFFFINTISWFSSCLIIYFILIQIVLIIFYYTFGNITIKDHSFILFFIFSFALLYILTNFITLTLIKYFFSCNYLKAINSLKFVLFFRIIAIGLVSMLISTTTIVSGSLYGFSAEVTKHINKVEEKIVKKDTSENVLSNKTVKIQNSYLINEIFSLISKKMDNEKEKELLILEKLTHNKSKIKIDDIKQYYKLLSDKEKQENKEAFNILKNMYNPETGLFSEIIKLNKKIDLELNKKKSSQVKILDKKIQDIISKVTEMDEISIKLSLKTIKWKPIGNEKIDTEMKVYYDEVVNDLLQQLN